MAEATMDVKPGPLVEVLKCGKPLGWFHRDTLKREVLPGHC